ncbi:AP-3 complex subunit delta [Puccinia graminis f. sp. tritici]|uniref:AP-3 complex subunit delta n=2 Tax=Puccinia graminis f. sp. tritici TaxID=56615 RepID=E3JQY0_PUCGT|nr:uncharacterized protein PGTG_00193 [Puccinia graminis f. sp. tritici CRL 75-36-700-3]EFP74237.2 hypothetical protein PGTG_00193 [Puccinia graminis f. sp. tritici CRL 75-36-700-3]KAA1115328.1 AP-3 complex subunit delta [Puccinia graminis f. sp. tritici]
MWEQSLSGLIKALRSSKDDEKRVIQQALSEIAQEVKSTDLDLKAAAILKLCYLDMLGYPQLSSYSFNVVECMSSNKFYIKQIGYLAASQSFGPNTEVSMLTTNLVKKDLVSHSSQPMSFLNLTNGNFNSTAPVLCLALSSLPHLLNSQNSADLSSDLVSMLNHSKPMIRKRAVTAIHTLASADMARMIEERGDLTRDQYAASADPASSKTMDIWVERFREKLLDDDIGVVSSTVNVICELASKEPWPWLELAAELYDLLKLKKNNWMMIKIVKIFTVLTPIEPRLTKKLLPALSDIISTTNAMSLLYECIHTILASGMLTHATSAEESYKLAKICIDKLAHFLDHVDQNLRYMALVGLNKLVPSHPELLEGYLETILELIHEVDPMLTIRALDLLEGIQYHSQTLKNTVDYLVNKLEGQKQHSTSEGTGQSDAVKALMSIQLSSKPSHLSPTLAPNHKLRIINVIITICSKSAYSHISDFNWFLEVLVRLIRLLVASQIEGTHTESNSSNTDGSHSVTRLANVLIDVSSRVRDIRPYAVNKMLSLLHDDTFLDNISNDYCYVTDIGSSAANSYGPDNEGASSASNLVTAAIWICGEYSDSGYVDLKDVISTLFKRQLILDNSSRLPQISTFALHNGLKVFVKWLREIVDSWYSEAHSDESYAEEEFQMAQNNSPKQSRVDVELGQLNRLVSAITDRARDLTKQKNSWASSNFFPTIDHVQLLDRANEVDRLMSLISRELIGYRPPTRPQMKVPEHQNEASHHAMYGMSSFGEANPFATSSGSPDEGFHRSMGDMNTSVDSSMTSSKTKQVQPPYWYKVLSDLFFVYELKPVANSAQAMIQAPDELDLDSWIPYLRDTSEQSHSCTGLDEFGRKIGEDFVNPYQSAASNGPFFDDPSIDPNFAPDSSRKRRAKKKKDPIDKEALAKARQDRIERQRDDPFYINTKTRKKQKEKGHGNGRTSTDLLDIDSIPIVKLDLSVSHDDPPTAGPSSISNSHRPHHLLKQTPSSSSSFSSASRTPVIDAEGEVPDLSYLQKYKTKRKEDGAQQKPVTALKTSSNQREHLNPNPPISLTPNDHTHTIVAHTPESIKVVKKKSSSKKKKKTDKNIVPVIN